MVDGDGEPMGWVCGVVAVTVAVSGPSGMGALTAPEAAIAISSGSMCRNLRECSGATARWLLPTTGKATRRRSYGGSSEFMPGMVAGPGCN